MFQRNENLSAGQKQQIVDRALGLLEGPDGAVVGLNLRALFIDRVLGERDYILSAAQLERLTRLSITAPLSPRRLPKHIKQAGPIESVQAIGMSLLMQYRGTPEEVVRQVLDRAPQYREDWLLVRHPNAPIDALRNMAQNDARHWPALAQSPKAMRDPVIRTRMAKSTALPVMCGLLEWAEPSSAGPLYARLMKHAPEAALEFLEAGRLPEGAVVNPLLFAPLLKSSDQAVRSRALMAIHRLGGSADGPVASRGR